MPYREDTPFEVAEVTRPARSLKEKFKKQIQKPQGRKQKHEPRAARYVHWLSPLLWPKIKMAAKVAGGPTMSSRSIVHYLKRQDSKTFSLLSPSTVEGWVDRTGDKPRWSESVVRRLQQGHQPGHSKGGRRGILVSQMNEHHNYRLLTIFMISFSGQTPRGC